MKNSVKYIIPFFIILMIGSLYKASSAQELFIRLDKSYDHLKWEDFKQKVEQNFNLRFYYEQESIPVFYVNVPSDTSSLIGTLKANLKKFSINVYADQQGNIFLLKNKNFRTSLPESFYFVSKPQLEEDTIKEVKQEKQFLSTRSEFIWKEATIGNRNKATNGRNAVISGKVISSTDKSPIFGANLFVEELLKGTATDANGYYQLKVPKGTYTLKISSLESHTVKYKIHVLSDGTLNLELEPQLYMLNEVVVKSDRFQHVRGTQMGFEKLSVKNIKEIPVVLGEKDITKVALLLPGVQSLGEGSSGFNVRGSPTDQNLFYINKVPVYNTSHLFGFFSAFNSDAIDEFALYKSNIPVQYGGRLSSIFELDAKQGSSNKFSARGGISPITSRLIVEGPLQKDKSSFLLAGRSTYSDWILKLLKDPDVRNSSGRFYDGIANFSVSLNQKNHLNVFAYGSEDNFKFSDILNHNYYNLGASLNWRHAFNNKSDIDFNFVYSKYGFNEENNELEYAAYYQSYELDHYQFNTMYSHKLSDRHELKFGGNAKFYEINRGDYRPLNEFSKIISRSFEPEQAVESAIFAGDLWKVNKKLTLEAGLRLNGYFYLGPHSVNKYIPGQPRIAENITGTSYFGDNEIIKNYTNIDYRLAANFLVNEDLSFKASYNRMHQYIFLLSNTIAISPTAIWKLSDYHIKPMTGNQISAGVYKNFWAGEFNASLEAYYKFVDDLVEYKDGAEFTLNKYPETDIIQGKLDAYGFEFNFKKPHGDLNGWFNYTYSRSIVTAIDPSRNEQNNFGLSYPSNYDKPHAVNLVVNYRIAKRLTTSTNIVYSTGRPITYPTAIYYQNDLQVLQYSLRNEYRIPDYFRVDLSVTLEGNLRKNKFAHGSWVVSVYNVTGRRNAYSVFFRNDDGLIRGYRMSIFGAPIFSIAYNFKLGNYED